MWISQTPRPAEAQKYKFPTSYLHPGDTFVAMSNILSSFVDSLGPDEVVGGGGGGGFAGGASESPRTMFTKQYSIKAMNTNIVHTDINASTAFR